MSRTAFNGAKSMCDLCLPSFTFFYPIWIVANQEDMRKIAL
jgi:hypothetical protein